MVITKDVNKYFAINYNNEIETLSDCAQENNGQVEISSLKSAYNFDKILQKIGLDNHGSVDCICFNGSSIDFIEFKGGVIDKIDKNYTPIETDCAQCKIFHREKFDYFIKAQENLKKVLHQNIQLKAIESLYIFAHHILPKCSDCEQGLKVRFICVFQTESLSPLDEFAEQQYALIKKSNEKIKAEKNSLTALLKNFECVDCNGDKIFYEECVVMTNLEFNVRREYA